MANSDKTESRTTNNKKPTELTRNQHVDSGVELYNYNAGLKEFAKSLDNDSVSFEKEDTFKGYVYASLRLRATKAADLATTNICTLRLDEESEKIHPYLEIIDKSKSESNFLFWYGLQTFLDICGVAYLYIDRSVRNLKDGRIVIGNVKDIRLLNSYRIKPVIHAETKELIGYKEKHENATQERSFRTENILPVRLFNPFHSIQGYATAHAADEQIYTKKEAGKYTRNAMRNNINAPGILATEMQLNESDAQNFKHDLKRKWGSGGPNAGSPIFANGAGALKWQDIKQDLDKMALETINEVNRQELFAVMGVSKTKLGIEVSGVTRETSKIQDSQFMADHIMPSLRLITDALNQDFKLRYMRQYSPTRPTIVVKSPIGKDYESLKCEEELLEKQLKNVEMFIKLGMSRADAFERAGVEIPEEVLFDDVPESRRVIEPRFIENNHKHVNNCCSEDKFTVNEAKLDNDGNLQRDDILDIRKERDDIINQIIELEEELLDYYLQTLVQNKVDDEQDYQDKLFTLLKNFWYKVVPRFAKNNDDKLTAKFSMDADFNLSAAVRNEIDSRLDKVVASHFSVIDNRIKAIISEATEQGFSRTKTANAIKKAFDGITDGSAKRIARTETNNAFMQAKFESDKQFINEHSLEDRAFKVWVVNSTNPCPFCLALEQEFNSQPIPFNQNFRDLGSVVEAEFELANGDATTRTLPVEFQAVNAGTVHPNCSCSYELIIR